MSLASRLRDLFHIEEAIDQELRERVDVVVSQVFGDVDKISPAVGNLLAGEPVELEIKVSLRLRAEGK